MKCIYFGADVYSGLWPTNTVAELILYCCAWGDLVLGLVGQSGEGGDLVWQVEDTFFTWSGKKEEVKKFFRAHARITRARSFIKYSTGCKLLQPEHLKFYRGPSPPLPDKSTPLPMCTATTIQNYIYIKAHKPLTVFILYIKSIYVYTH